MVAPEGRSRQLIVTDGEDGDVSDDGDVNDVSDDGSSTR